MFNENKNNLAYNKEKKKEREEIKIYGKIIKTKIRIVMFKCIRLRDYDSMQQKINGLKHQINK